MDITRRRFLTGLGVAGAVIAVPELLLPRKTFFLPPAGGWNGSSVSLYDAYAESFKALGVFQDHIDLREFAKYFSLPYDNTGRIDMTTTMRKAAGHAAAVRKPFIIGDGIFLVSA